ncbi:MAG TPA: dipeptidase PepE [Flavisolibacter sp.]|nr:dipeptidase PepE [Flavisolibacter sp.]
MRVLAFSSSRVGDEAYLQTAAPVIKEFLGAAGLSIAFVPFASVDQDYEAYTDRVREGLNGLPYTINTVTPANAKEVIESCDVIMTGGGNTFKLLHHLYDLDLLKRIKQKVHSGTPYIGWSAGANIAGLTIGTTNDMPIIEPKSFRAFGFLPFQINPHYYNVVTKGFNGETRDQRLEEFLKMNDGASIVCLPEGTALRLENGLLVFVGDVPGIVMKRQRAMLVRTEINRETDLSYLLQ